VLSGVAAARATFGEVDPALEFERRMSAGDALRPGALIARVSGSIRSILTAERVALNFLQRLCGIATLTARFVRQVRGTGVEILDTRKTTPGLRFLEKLAVQHGGGVNHRFGLFDAIMIKDNHAVAAGGLAEAIRRAQAARGDQVSRELPLIVEVRTLAEVRVAAREGVERVLLDNFTSAKVTRAVEILRQMQPHRIRVEVSGGISLENAASFAVPGVDYISVGALTHSAPALDVTLDLEEAIA